jgi:serine-type D-Ala-D-Ala carboxypeptidase/endopeptidase
MSAYCISPRFNIAASMRHPGRVLGWLLCAAWSATALAAEAPQPPPSSAWSIPSDDSIRQLLAQRMQHNDTAIVVGVIEPSGRRIVAHGSAGEGTRRPVDGDTVFQIGSVTKVFTALVLAQMVRSGEVKFDDAASNYLPRGAAMPQRGRPITLADLVTHTSGLPSMPTNYDLSAEPDPYAAYTNEQLCAFLATYELPRAPGEASEYSNLGVSLLGQLLARRAGTDYEALSRARVLEPLGMRSTSIALTPDQKRRLAPGHDRYFRPVTTWEMSTLPASGSLRSTANDMLVFLAANLGEGKTPLEEAMVFQRKALSPPIAGSQALGWGVSDVGGERIFSHQGGKQGYRSAVAFNPERGTGIVVLANARSDDGPGAIAMHLLAGRELPPVPPAPPERTLVELDHELLDRYAGRYRLAPDRVLTVARRHDHLLVDSTGNGVSEFFAIGSADFFLNTGNDEIGFQLDAHGRVTGLALFGDGRSAGAPQIAARIDDE